VYSESAKNWANNYTKLCIDFWSYLHKQWEDSVMTGSTQEAPTDHQMHHQMSVAHGYTDRFGW
jgi:hypothetical protein